jgi:hypothetical protein
MTQVALSLEGGAMSPITSLTDKVQVGPGEATVESTEHLRVTRAHKSSKRNWQVWSQGPVMHANWLCTQPDLVGYLSSQEGHAQSQRAGGGQVAQWWAGHVERLQPI